ncbi:MAG TPA: thioredoxin domain-containing protein [Bacteroidia bacterium]|nr:thioredoxin domain-containing protein [Bacteroidia bacterium]
MNDILHSKANQLIHESSPYLLQHAYNPVHWLPWSDDAFARAKQENKLVLISIGYSACHWCHVMEHESFEDKAVAEIMNANFICIKVDREERPDVDQVYMTAVQIMTGSGGWPLNCFTLPDGRPIYGGTYFPQQEWVKVLRTLADYYKNETERVYQYANELTAAVRKADLLPPYSEKPSFSKDTLIACVENWTKRFDNEEGGPKKVPKFPLPNNYKFLLRYSQTLNQWEKLQLIKHIDLTLTKMAYGGINDQIGGGFARYSTDGEWKVPHFEKMLYDNAQLVSLYSEAYQLSKNPLYKQMVYETLDFIEREMTSPEGAFYSALDADSEGEEGKYYVWTKEELMNITNADFSLFKEYFNVNDIGLWEEENYILLRKKSDEEIAKQFHLNTKELQSKIGMLKNKVLAEREKRIKPGLDNKILTSWNALMIKGYADAYLVFSDEKFINKAITAADFLLKNLLREDGGLWHQATNKPSTKNRINGFHEDYAFTIEAFVSLYQASLEEKYLTYAKSFTEYAIKHFYDPVSGMFFFTSDLDPELISRKLEIQDNVTPASNSSMALSLFYLATYFDSHEYLSMSEKMLKQVHQEMINYGSAYSNWAILQLYFTQPFYQLVIVGNSVEEKRQELSKHYLPNMIFAGSKLDSNLTLLKNKYSEGRTLIYVCENKTCKNPTENIREAVEQMS